MSFSGTVEKESYEGGLMVAFEGRAPRLGATLRVIGGKSIGRVNTVIGSRVGHRASVQHFASLVGSRLGA